MSDHDHDHGHERGGHEIDKLPNARLFNLLFGLSFLVLISSIGVIQLFNMQVAGIEKTRAQQVSFRLQDYNESMSKVLGGYGTVTVREETGDETVAYHMPVAEARRRVLDKPELLRATPAYRGWDKSSVGKTISTLQEANKAALPPALPTQREAPGDGAGEPAGEPPAGEQPAGEKPAEEKPAGEQPAGEQPAGEKPAAEKPAGEKPAGEKPAGEKPAGEKPAAEKPAGEKPAAEKPAEGEGQ